MAAGELAFGEEVVEGDITRGGEVRSSGEDTPAVEDSEMESGDRSLGDGEAGEDMTAARDRVRRWKGGERGQRRQEGALCKRAANIYAPWERSLDLLIPS